MRICKTKYEVFTWYLLTGMVSSMTSHLTTSVQEGVVKEPWYVKYPECMMGARISASCIICDSYYTCDTKY